MSTDTNLPEKQIMSINTPLSMQELTEVLIKHYGLTEGNYDLMVEFQIGTGPVGPNKDSLVPGAMIGVSRIGLVPAAESSTNAVNAAVVNNTKKSRKKT